MESLVKGPIEKSRLTVFQPPAESTIAALATVESGVGPDARVYRRRMKSVAAGWPGVSA